MQHSKQFTSDWVPSCALQEGAVGTAMLVNRCRNSGAIGMPKFYFHIRSAHDFVEDLEGVTLDGEKEAYEEATHAAREILSERVRKGDVVDGHIFDVHDESGTKLFSLPFRDVLRFH
jgi:hypothetical protein